MPKVMKTCRVCGKTYEACRIASAAVGIFRWQDVACSPECGAVYLQQINESRAPKTAVADTESADTKKRTSAASRRKRAETSGPSESVAQDTVRYVAPNEQPSMN